MFSQTDWHNIIWLYQFYEAIVVITMEHVITYFVYSFKFKAYVYLKNRAIPGFAISSTHALEQRKRSIARFPLFGASLMFDALKIP